MGKNKNSNKDINDIYNSTVSVDIVKTKKDWVSVIISIISLILSLAVLISSIIQFREDKKMNNINTPLRLSVYVENGPDETTKMVDGEGKIQSILNYKIQLDKQGGELYNITVFTPISLKDNSFKINNYSESLKSFNDQILSINLGDIPNMHFAFSIIKIVDTNKNVIWATFAVPIPSKSLQVAYNQNTKEIKAIVNYETINEESKDENAILLMNSEVLSDSNYLANQIFDSYYETEEQKDWARQQRTHEDNVNDNQINQGKLYCEIDEKSKEELMAEVDLMKNAFSYVYNNYGV